ncbi:epoxide hydrolase 4-like [Tripterygium wilfordii]|uniref:Epoxide hydrolase 4-like n=1 Tax=Tripterygium wilfordii TaxID=458696 RepID=A0A7J7DYE2_TRIWF|nr:epoxide hydrolase 1-like [Tripterygium wilfordii]KAF5751096.1 epoxide hydrolase 4-like [Tripterygium wilfordii]
MHHKGYPQSSFTNRDIMVNSINIYMSILRVVIKLVGLKPQRVEIEPGTVVNIWGPAQSKPNKPSIVFLHGFAANGILTWQFQVLSLAKNYNIYVPDFLFFGDSATEKPDRSPVFQAECMVEALRILGVEKCTVVGFSYGGMVGFKMAELYPDLVEFMVVTCSVMGLTESITRAALERLGFGSWADLLIPDSVNGVKVCFKDIASYKLPWMPGFIWEDYFKVMFDYRKEKAELLEALVVFDKDFYVPQYSHQRIHIISGENDQIFTKDVVLKLKEQVGDKGSLRFIAKAGHLVNLERPNVYNRHLKEVLASFYHQK